MDSPEAVPASEDKRQESPSDIFYHYTTIEGLLGIIEKGELWATHVKYLNDTSELQAGLNTVLDMWIEEQSKPKPFASGKLGRLNLLVSQSTKPVFVSSFSAEETGDDLSQWRAYGGSHSGFSLGFSREYLNAIGANFLSSNGGLGWSQIAKTHLLKCRYFDPRDQTEIRWLADQLVGEQAAGQPVMGPELATHFFARYSASLKQKGFSAEKEWRIALIRGNDDAFEGMRFRCSNSLVIPYVSIPLKWDGHPIKISRIVVGPTPHRVQAKESVEMLLKKHKVQYGEIAESSIPYRNW